MVESATIALALGLSALILGPVSLAALMEAAGRRDRLAELRSGRRRRWTVPPASCTRRDCAETRKGRGRHVRL